MQSDAQLLQQVSTSPQYEAPTFLQDIRESMAWCVRAQEGEDPEDVTYGRVQADGGAYVWHQVAKVAR